MKNRSDVKFEQFSRRRCLLRSVLVAIIVIAVVLVIVIPVIYISNGQQTKNEEDQDTLSGINDNNTSTLPTSKPDETTYSLNLDEIRCFTADRLEVKVTTFIQYYPTDTQLATLNDTYGAAYEEVLRVAAVDSLKGATPSFTIREMVRNAQSTRLAICDAIKRTLENMCCANFTKCDEFYYDLLVPDPVAMRFDQVLLLCVTDDTCDHLFFALMFTEDYRDGIAKGYPLSTRVQDVFQRYQIFHDINVLITSLTSRINRDTGLDTANIESLRINVLNMTELILHRLSSMNLQTTEILNTSDEKVLYAFPQLSTIFQEPNIIEDGMDLPIFVHTVETGQWSAEAQRHNGSVTPWILYNKSSVNSSISIMVQDQVLVNVTSAADAILGLMATYYVTSVPYPAHRYGTFLFIESELLYGKIKDDDAQLLQRLKDLFYT